MNRLLASALAASCVLSGPPAGAQVPKLNWAIPAGICPGQPVDINFAGEALAKPAGVWTNLPGKVALAPVTEGNPAAADRVTCRCELPADAPLGVYALRLATERGISNLRLLVVDDLPTVVAVGENRSPAQAQPLELPVAVEGAIGAENRQYYRFHVAAGQRLSIELWAERFGSPLDSQVRLLNESGQELAYNDDDEATGSDSRFVYRFAAGGQYILEIGDVRYFGGADYRYRLRLGDFPLVTAPFPLGVQAGSVGRIQVTGTDVGQLPALEVLAPADRAQSLRLHAAYPAGQGSGMFTIPTGRGPEQVEIEPNDRPETASPLEPTGALSGRFGADHDRDYFRFAAQKGARLSIVGRTRSLGITRDVLLRLFDSQGKPLAAGTPTKGDDTQIDFTFPDDGTYTLLAEDLTGHGGPDHVYRLEFAPAVAGFSLTTDADRYNVPRGGVFQIKIAVARGGYAGPIALAIVMPGVPVHVPGNDIPADKADGLLTVTVPEGLPPGTWQTFQVVGRATIDGQPFEAQASSLAALQTALGGMRNPPPELDGLLTVGIGPVFPPFMKLEAVDPVVLVPQLSGKATVKLKVTRSEGFSGPVSLTAEELPAGFALAPPAAVINENQQEFPLEITTPLAIVEGDYPVRIVATGTHSLQLGRATIDMTLRVVKPLPPAPTPGPAEPAETPPAKQVPK